jgi:hypothetical protein
MWETRIACRRTFEPHKLLPAPLFVRQIVAGSCAFFFLLGGPGVRAFSAGSISIRSNASTSA